MLHPAFKFTRDDYAQYDAIGFVLLSPFLSACACAELQQHVDRILASSDSNMSKEWIMNVHLLGETWLLELARNKALLDAVEFICGHDITLIQTHLFCKPIGCPETPWHQDARDQDATMATVWISLDDLTHPSSGALCVLPQLHSYGLLPSKPSDHFQFDNVLLPDFVARFESFAYNLNAGEAAIHHPLLPHASMPNTTLPYRRVIVLRYLATQALESERVPLYRVMANQTLKILCGDTESADNELYQDYRDSNVYFEGRCIVLRGKYLSH